MDPFVFLQIQSQLDDYKIRVDRIVRENRQLALAAPSKARRPLTPGGERFILLPVRKHAGARA
jgi:hypothetical protein